MFHAVQGKAGLIISEELWWKSEEICYSSYWEVPRRCYLIRVSRWGASGKNVPNAHLPIPRVDSERVNQYMDVRIFKLNEIIILHQNKKKMFGIAPNMQEMHQFWNTFQLTSESQNIPHPWPAVCEKIDTIFWIWFLELWLIASVTYDHMRISLQQMGFIICKIAGCACTGNAGNVFPTTNFNRNSQ